MRGSLSWAEITVRVMSPPITAVHPHIHALPRLFEQMSCMVQEYMRHQQAKGALYVSSLISVKSGSMPKTHCNNHME